MRELVGDLQMGFHDAAFLHSRANSYTIFLKHRGMGQSLGIAACHRTMFVDEQ